MKLFSVKQTTDAPRTLTNLPGKLAGAHPPVNHHILNLLSYMNFLLFHLLTAKIYNLRLIYNSISFTYHNGSLTYYSIGSTYYNYSFTYHSVSFTLYSISSTYYNGSFTCYSICFALYIISRVNNLFPPIPQGINLSNSNTTHSLFFVSMRMVTGPSFTSEISIMAPNLPV